MTDQHDHDSGPLLYAQQPGHDIDDSMVLLAEEQVHAVDGWDGPTALIWYRIIDAGVGAMRPPLPGLAGEMPPNQLLEVLTSSWTPEVDPDVVAVVVVFEAYEADARPGDGGGPVKDRPDAVETRWAISCRIDNPGVVRAARRIKGEEPTLVQACSCLFADIVGWLQLLAEQVHAARTT